MAIILEVFKLECRTLYAVTGSGVELQGPSFSLP